jgi:hypothetical protein
MTVYYCASYDEDGDVMLLTLLGVESPERVKACRKAYELYTHVATSGLKLDEATAAKIRSVVLDVCGPDALFIVLAEHVLGCEVMTAEEVEKLMKESERLKKVAIMDMGKDEMYVLEKNEKGEWRRALEV